MIKRINKKVVIIMMAIIVALAVFAAKGLYDLRQILYFSNYSEHDSSYLSEFYADKNVLFLVPHEDDDYNLAGGILEQYVNAGSNVHIMYMTNGDAYGGGELRINESALAMARVGIPSENLIFLGYGDSWDNEEYGHIYQAPGDEPLISLGGFENTYGTDQFIDFHTSVYGESALYTRNNIKSDIKDVINLVNPDTIFGIECDEHPDHRALSLLFEECMGEIKKDNKAFSPKLYKGFGYCTGWDGVRDYYADNVESVKYETPDGRMLLRPQYMWDERLRFPVAASTLAFTEHSSSAYPVLDAFASQDALNNFTCLINSDKVFWERRTDSVLYDALITTSNGEDGTVLNDFKLSDIKNIRKEPKKTKWNRGVCHLHSGDSVKVALNKPEYMEKIVLYDSAYDGNDIINGTIKFDDGYEIIVDNICYNGSPTCIEFEGRMVNSFEFIAGDTKGEEPGLLEIEAYGSDENSVGYSYVKLMADGNFMYDYNLKVGKEVIFDTYTYPEGIETKIYIDDKEYDGSVYKYDGRKHVITAKTVDDDLYDQAYIYNLSLYKQMLIKIARTMEEKKWIK